jgi:UDP:flavonoid glycosyltransferase YjiC (YdhE family)
LPSWWNEVPTNKPIVYLTLGSSGRHELLPVVLRALAKLDVTVLLSTAGRAAPEPMPNLFCAPFLPGHQAVARAALVISNGGSTTGYQALAGGVPVLGIASNLDQFLAMKAITTVGAGVVLRAGSLKESAVGEAVKRLLAEPGFAQAARTVAQDFAQYDSAQRFERELASL